MIPFISLFYFYYDSIENRKKQEIFSKKGKKIRTPIGNPEIFIENQSSAPSETASSKIAVTSLEGSLSSSVTTTATIMLTIKPGTSS